MRHRFRRSYLCLIQMSNHTIGSWKKYCLHHEDTVEDLRKRAISNAEKRTEDIDMTGTGASEVALFIPQPPSPSESQPPPPPHADAVEPVPVPVKTEPLDDDQLDFAFATDVLSGWNANEESDAELWKRMEIMVCSLVLSWGFWD